MSAPSGSDVSGIGTFSGPHLCVQVGANVAAVLQAALVDMCERRGGKLTKIEIDHVFDLVTASTQLFDLFQTAYSGCVDLKQASRFVDVDGTTITRFVVSVYSRDVIAKVFRTQIKARGQQWTNAFVGGLVTFLVEDIDPELPRDLYQAYRTLASRLGGSLTPVTLLNSQEFVTRFGTCVSRLHDAVEHRAGTLEQLEAVANESIAKAFDLSGPAREKLNDVSCNAFVTRLSGRSDGNPFRNLVLGVAA